MKTLQYKKTYEGDYNKSYQATATLKKEREVLIQEYQKTSKKLDQYPYCKDEKKTNYSAGQRAKKLDKLNADGSTGKESNTSTKQSKDKSSLDQEVTISPKLGQDRNVEKMVLKNEPEEPQIQYDYADVGYPLDEIGTDRFVDTKTGREVGLEDARKILAADGYQPKIGGDFGKVLFFFILANFFFKLLAPVVVIFYGLIKINTKRTTWSKKTDQITHRYSLSASKEEIQMNKRIGQIFFAIGIITAFIHYSSLFE